MARHRAAQRTSVISESSSRLNSWWVVTSCVLFAVVDGPGEEGEEVEEEKDRVLPERVMWYPHEDSFVG